MTSTPITTRTTTDSPAGGTIDRLIAAFNSCDMARLAACFAADAVQVHPMLGVTHGREAIAAGEATIFSAFTEVAWEATHIVVAADGAWHAIEWRVTARNTAPLAMPTGVVPATGLTVDLAGSSLLQIGADGLVHAEHRYFDPGQVFAQLGLAPS